MKYLILDAGPLISLAMNGLLRILEGLSEKFEGEIILTPDVKREVVDHPLNTKRYELEAIKIKNLLDKKILKPSEEIIPNKKLEEEKNRIMNQANSVFYDKHTGKKIKIIQDGEASCLAFSRLCNQENLLVIDERTTRLLIEAPFNLKKLLQKKLHTEIKINNSLTKNFKKFKLIRSTEIAAIAYEKNILNLGKSKKVIEAVLYGLKFKGTAISSHEIEKLKNMLKPK